MNRKDLLVVCASVLLLLNSCSKTAPADEAKLGAHNEFHEESSTTLTAEQIKSIGITLGHLEKKQLTAALKANGILKVPNQNRATISSPIGGIVKSILVQAGQSVKAGQLICTLYNSEFVSMQEAYLTVKAKVELASSEFARQKNLSQASATAMKNFQQAETELKTLTIRQASLKHQLEQLGTNTMTLSTETIHEVMEVRSALSGSVSNVLVNIGSHVDPANPIAEIVDNSQLHLDLYVYEKDISKISVGQIIHFSQTNNQGREYDARIFGISNTFEPQTKAITVHARVEGKKDNLIDGTSVSAVISLQSAMLDAVPTTALVNSQGQDYIFVSVQSHEQRPATANDHTHDRENVKRDPSKDGNHNSHDGEIEFRRIPVRQGTSDVGYTEITPLESLSPDAQVVTTGAFFILAKLTNSGESHEH